MSWTKNKWPSLILAEEAKEGLTQEDTLIKDKEPIAVEANQEVLATELNSYGTQVDGDRYTATEEDLMDSFSNMSKDFNMEEGEEGWQSPKSKKKKKKKAKKVVAAIRTSSRIPKDGISITEKATLRAMAKNNITGKSSVANPFTILSDTPEAMLQNVIGDLDIECANVDAQIGVFKAEELAGAALAEANYKVFLDKQKERDKTRDDDSEDLTMVVIDNSMRFNTSVSNDNT